MDDLSQRLQSLLSDPESMQNLAELAAMLRQPEQNEQPQSAGMDLPPPQEGADTPEMPMPDIGKLMAVGQALMQTQQDENTALLLALKPHLSPARAKRADQAVRLLRLYRAAAVLQENGMLKDLFGG